MSIKGSTDFLKTFFIVTHIAKIINGILFSYLTFNFEIIIVSQSSKNSRERCHIPFTHFPQKVTSYLIRVQYQNQKIHIYTIQLTEA